MEAKIIYKEEEKFRSGFVGDSYTYIPAYLQYNGKEVFIRNHCPTDTFSKRDIEAYAEQIIKNDWKYFCYYGAEKDINKWLDWIIETGKTFTSVSNGEWYPKFDNQEDYGLYDLHGNLCECSAGFHYRIYDKELAYTILTKCRQHINNRRNFLNKWKEKKKIFGDILFCNYHNHYETFNDDAEKVVNCLGYGYSLIPIGYPQVKYVISKTELKQIIAKLTKAGLGVAVCDNL